MELSLVEIWESMGFLARLVAIGLVGMGFASLCVAFERLLVLRRSDVRSGEFAEKARPMIQDHEFEDLLKLSKKEEYASAPLARLVRFGIEAAKATGKDDKVGQVEIARRELVRKLEVLASELRRGTGVLAPRPSSGCSAPSSASSPPSRASRPRAAAASRRSPPVSRRRSSSPRSASSSPSSRCSSSTTSPHDSIVST